MSGDRHLHDDVIWHSCFSFAFWFIYIGMVSDFFLVQQCSCCLKACFNCVNCFPREFSLQRDVREERLSFGDGRLVDGVVLSQDSLYFYR